jgi:hypothetical protein
MLAVNIIDGNKKIKYAYANSSEYSDSGIKVSVGN